MVETSSDTRNLLHPPPALPKCSPSGLAPPVKEALDRIGAKCITISNNLPLASTKLVPLLHITNNDLEKVTENLFRPKIGSFPMQVTKYLAENFNLQTITYQKTPGVLDTNNNRLPQDYHLAVMLQGISEPQGLPIETVEEEFHSLLEYDIKDIGTKNETLAPQYSWIPSYSLTPILGASVLFGVALSMWLKK